jgi:hypothetical protein
VSPAGFIVAHPPKQQEAENMEGKLEVALRKNITVQHRQEALVPILSALLEVMSPGELRVAIRAARGGEEVLNYEHPLLPDPPVSCASKQQLLGELERRFPGEEAK